MIRNDMTNHNNWTEDENTSVLNAIEQGISVSHVIELIANDTGRSEKSITKKLIKIGYLRSNGRTFSSKNGFTGR